MAQNIGTLVGAAIRPIDDTMPIASAFAFEINGGHHQVATLVARNAIISQRRQWGMLCTVYSDSTVANNKTYQLKYGYYNTDITNNSNWTVFAGSAGADGGSSWVEPVLSVTMSAPGFPFDGERYLVGLSSAASLSGSFSTLTNAGYVGNLVGGYIAEYKDGLSGWETTLPADGMTLRVNDQDNSFYRYEGTYSTGQWYKERVNQVRQFSAASSNRVDYTITTGDYFTYSTEAVYLVQFATSNSGSAATLNINGLGQKSIRKQGVSGLSDFSPNDLNSSGIYNLIYDGTSFRVTLPPGAGGAFTLKYKIVDDERIEVPAYSEYLLYGDLEVNGILDISSTGKVVIINGALNVNGGTVSNSGNIQLVTFATASAVPGPTGPTGPAGPTGATGPALTIVEVTKTELDTLIGTNGLLPGLTYKISGVHPTLYDDGTSSGTTIFLQALTTNKLSEEGSGLFYNPIYASYPIWEKDNYWTVDTMTLVGVFDANEAITADNGATAYLTGTIESNQFFPLTGDWTLATSITGDVSGATVNISGVIYPNPNPGDQYIWGGYSWTNITGDIGTATSIYSLDSTNWSKDTYDETNYNLVIDAIAYDYANDMIIKRHETEANNLVVYTAGDYSFFGTYYGFSSAISVFMWGNPYSGGSGLENNIIENSYFECVDFKGDHIINNSLGGHSAIFGNNSYLGTRISFNILHDSAIAANTAVNSGYIQYNRMTSGSIIGNTLTNNSTIIGNVITDSSLLNNTLSVDAAIQYNDILNVSRIDDNILINCFIGTNYLYDICWIVGNTLTQVVDDTSIDANTLTTNSRISANTLVDSYIQQNKLNAQSYIQFNDLTVVSKIGINNLDYSSINGNSFITVNVLNNDLSYSSLIRLNILESSNVTGNSLTESSYIESNDLIYLLLTNNNLSNVSYIDANTNSVLTIGPRRITDNILNKGRIRGNDFSNNDKILSNVLNESSIQYNVFTSLYSTSSGIEYNVLNSSRIDNNQLLLASLISYNNLTNSGIENVILNNVDFTTSIMNDGGFDGFSTTGGINTSLTQLDIRNIIVTDDVSAATIIYGDYSKYIFKIDGANSKLGYYDTAGSFTVQNVNA